MEPWRHDMIGRLLGLVGKVWYAWAGQTLTEYGGQCDCSGLVIEILKDAGRLPEDFADTTANGLCEYYNHTSHPMPGDLVFYGEGDRATHVMIWLGDCPELGISDAVVGMASGRRNETATQAKLRGDALWVRPVGYRSDLMCYGRVE